MRKIITILVFALCTSYAVSQQYNSHQINLKDSLGNKVGTWIEYNPNGSLESIKFYTKGKLQGLSYQFDTLGRIQVICQYKNGVKDGDYRAFYPNGKLKLYVKSKNGKRVHYLQFSEKEELVMEQLYDENGKTINTIFFKDGKKISESK